MQLLDALERGITHILRKIGLVPPEPPQESPTPIVLEPTLPTLAPGVPRRASRDKMEDKKE